MILKNKKNILLTAFFAILLTLPSYAQSQNALEEKHGFQDIILDSEVTDNKNFVFKKSIRNKKTEQPILLYERIKGTYQRIGDVPVKTLEVKTFLGKIIEIRIIADKDEDIMRALKKLYGEPYFSVRSNAWEWRSEGVLLALSATGKNKLEIIYSSRKFNQYIQDHKEEGIENISNDF